MPNEAGFSHINIFVTRVFLPCGFSLSFITAQHPSLLSNTDFVPVSGRMAALWPEDWSSPPLR